MDSVWSSVCFRGGKARFNYKDSSRRRNRFFCENIGRDIRCFHGDYLVVFAVPEPGFAYRFMEVLDRQTILSPGSMLGCYRIVNFLGQGGFGVTYIARDTMLDIQVAIKEYLPEKIAERSSTSTVQPRSDDDIGVFRRGLANFLKEARTLARFNHRNIVRVMSVFELNDTAYMVMEYERGHDLKVIFNQRERINETFLKSIIGPVLDGLDEVHRHGFIHRDIKPANILVRDNGIPVLLDFGSARLAIGNSTETFTAMVTAGFAPLEQYSGLDDQQGPWTDVYALGAVLYYAVTGNAPPDSAVRGAGILNEKGDPFVPLSRLAPVGYSSSFCRSVDWALQFKVSSRPQSLNQWRARLFDNEPFAGKAGQSATKTATVKAKRKRAARVNDTSSDLTVINDRMPGTRSGQSKPTGLRSGDKYELADPVHFNANVSADEEFMSGIFRSKENVSRPYLVPGIAIALLVSVAALFIFIVLQSSSQDPAIEDDLQVVAVQEPTQKIIEGDEQKSDTQASSVSLGTPTAPTEQDELATQAQIEAEKAETERLSAERAERQEADRAVQRMEARKQVEMAAKLEAEAAAAKELEQKASAEREAEKQASIAREEVRRRVAEQASRQNTAGPIISSADMSSVLSRFNALSTAIEQRDSAALEKITVKSDRKSAYFNYVFRTFDKIESKISKISASRQDKTIRAMLTVERMIRNNGDIAIPPDEFRNIPIYSVKETKWSAIHW